MAEKGVVTLDGNRYVTLGPVTRTIVSTGGFPEAQPESGTPMIENYLAHKRAEQSPLWSIGRRNSYDAKYIWDEYNVNSLFPGTLTLGPLKQAPTFTGGPATFKVRVGTGFGVTNDTIWMFGNGAAAADEPLWYLSTTTWTDSTLNADIAATINDLAGIVQIDNTYYAINRIATSIGGDLTAAMSSTDKLVWARVNIAGQPDGSAALEYHFPVAYQRSGSWRIGCVVQADTTGELTIRDRLTTTSAAFTTVGADTIRETTLDPRGMVVWQDSAGAQDLFLGTNKSLWWFDVSATALIKLFEFQNPDSSYTGQITVSQWDNRLYFTDGGNVGRVYWLESGLVRVDYFGPTAQTSATVQWDGVPTTKSGDVTCIAASRTRPWIYVGFGGLAASRNAWVGVYNIPTGTWHCIYRNATAQRAITAIMEFADTLHFMEEQAAGGDQDPQYFATVTDNPVVNTTYVFASSGVVTTSRFSGFTPMLRKGFYQFHAVGRGITSNENLSVAIASNDGTLGTAQTISSSPGNIWTDGATTALGTDAYDIYAEITLNRGATNTNSPKVEAIGWSYDPKALKNTDTPVFSFSMTVSRDPVDYGNELRPEQILSRLATTFATRTLVNFSFDEGKSNAVSAKVQMLPYQVTMQPDAAGELGAVKSFTPVEITLVERV